jgi:hypothetical protein
VADIIAAENLPKRKQGRLVESAATRNHGMDGRSNFKAGIAMLTRTKEPIQFVDGSQDSPAGPVVPSERRAAGDMTHSVGIIAACKPNHWRHKFLPSNAPSAEVARKAGEWHGSLLDGPPQT